MLNSVNFVEPKSSASESRCRIHQNDHILIKRVSQKQNKQNDPKIK